MWKWKHGSVTDEVASPSAGVGCMLQDVRNPRNIFENHKECPVERGCCGRTLVGRYCLKVEKCIA